jgi:drug/metabolite transporter (DMT)-like permease
MRGAGRGLGEIHAAVLLFGVAGLFGKLLSLNPLVIVFGRVLFSSLFLFLAAGLGKKSIRIGSLARYARLAILGCLLAFHWVSFFWSIQLSSVAVGLLSFSTFPVFVAMLNPFVTKEKLDPIDFILAFLAFGGVAVIVPTFNRADPTFQGLFWGVLSGLSYAILSIANGRLSGSHSSLQIALYEQFFAMLILAPFMVFLPAAISARDVLLLALLGTLFTGLSHLLFIEGLRTVRAQTAGIVSMLEPLYGILAAVLVLGSLPGLREAIGGLIILAVVFFSGWREARRSNAQRKSETIE